MQKNTVRTFILTGFLGSGKTTLLNGLLEHEKNKLNYVVENEFGKVSVDNALIAKNYNQLFELNNGCICCSLDGELVEVLAQLIHVEHQPDNLFIEASGVADAGQLASIFKREDVMQYYHLQQVICLVDAENFEERIEEVPELYRQIVASDLVLINKCDLVREPYIDDVQRIISGINPFARIVRSEFARFDFGVLTNKAETIFSGDLLKEVATVPSGHRMKSIAIEVPNRFERNQLFASLSTTILLYYHQLYRIKGFVKLEGEEKPVLVQSTGKKLSLTSCVESEKSPPLMLVFIGKDIERKGLERILNRITLFN